MSDISLRQDILDELEFEPSVNAAHIGVAVEKGVATLTGHVSSYAEKVAAEHAAQRVKGVRGIAEEIEVRYPDAKKTADDEIAKRALSIIGWDTTIPDDRLMVKVQNGWITLSGEVAWNYQRSGAEDAVRKLSGVFGRQQPDHRQASRRHLQPQASHRGRPQAERRNRSGQHPRRRIGRRGDARRKVNSWYSAASPSARPGPLRASGRSRTGWWSAETGGRWPG